MLVACFIISTNRSVCEIYRYIYNHQPYPAVILKHYMYFTVAM